MRNLKWSPRNHIFEPRGDLAWMNEYAQVPVPVVLQDRIRIYFSTRPQPDENKNYVSHVGFIDTSKDDPCRIIDVSKQPALSPGGLGEFDEHGVMAGTVIRNNNDKFTMWYQGWKRCSGVPYDWAMGIAVSKDGGKTFRKADKGPVISATPKDPFLLGGARVVKLGGAYHLFYHCGIEWIRKNKVLEPIYRIKKAFSEDGIHWERNGRCIIPSVEPYECQAGTAVFEHGDCFHMYFSFRRGFDFRNHNNGYRIGYACSDDLETWHRDPEPLPFSEHGEWDSEMMCYPSIVKMDQRYFLFYCGNYFGKHGFGYVEIE